MLFPFWFIHSVFRPSRTWRTLMILERENFPMTFRSQAAGSSQGLRSASRLQMVMLSLAGRVMGFRPFGPRPKESIMQFSSNGKLPCICMPPRTKRPNPERRQTCRTCGLEIRLLSRNVDRTLTRTEIEKAVKGLCLAGIRAGSLEVPSSVTSLRQLNAYLASQPGGTRVAPPPQPVTSRPSEAN